MAPVFWKRFSSSLVGLLLGLLSGGGWCAADLPLEPVRAELRATLTPVVDLEAGWREPPVGSRAQCWWWWLNGNVTKEGITRDLEQMRLKGLGGANIIDAGGADQRGNRQVSHGPDFGTPAWRELFVHALREADRLGLEMGLNIQSGWNLGGPTVSPEHAAKKLTWAEVTFTGGEKTAIELPQPTVVGGYYRDLAVLALPVSTDRSDELAIRVEVDSAQEGQPASELLDGDTSTYWVSGTYNRGEGPNLSQPHRIDFEFATPTAVSRIVIHPREGYGPKRGWVQASDRPKRWQLIGRWTAERDDEPVVIDIKPSAAKRYRLIVAEAFDPRSPAEPRNVQVAEVEFFNGDVALNRATSGLARVDNFRQKAYYDYPGAFTATKADHLLDTGDGDSLERVLSADEAIDLTDRIDSEGRLDWRAPPGVWTVVRIGSTLAGSRVSTHSEGWEGWAIDYLDRDAFTVYWGDVVRPLLEAAGTSVGVSLKYLHTDSWELGPVNWTPRMAEEFRQRRGYTIRPYLPVLAGYVVGDRETSNRFLNDYRRTLADLIADSNYGVFREYAHAEGLGTHPESGGPHAAPIDALQCLGRNDVPMGEFWARSKTHRVNDYERLFILQAASAAHTYGRRVVLAESFTSIGPQWEEDPAMLKPVFDRVACEGLNQVMLHTFASSPPESGLPGQAYFAGSHINPNTTWWTQSEAFFGYLNRCQFLLQQGLPVVDVLHFYGENVPSFVRLKNDNPAGDLTGYGYDVINAEALLGRVSVKDGLLILPEGATYKLLSLPRGDSYGLAALRRIAELVDAGAIVVGPRASKPLGLLGEADQQAFDALAARLWGKGGPIREQSAREALEGAGVARDFDSSPRSKAKDPTLDYFHRRTDTADVYFVANRTDAPVEAECDFRVAGPAPEIWDAVTGAILPASRFHIGKETTKVPLALPVGGSCFVVFRGDRSTEATKEGPPNLPDPTPAGDLDLAWSVTFDPARGGPGGPVEFAKLTDWTASEDTAVRYYSGQATYRAEWDLTEGRLSGATGQRCWLDLGEVRNVASVRLNGEQCGVAWTAPYRVEITGKLKKENQLEIDIVNLWPNRLIGDAGLPESERTTRTNITKFRADSPLLPSGLLGPVRLMTE